MAGGQFPVAAVSAGRFSDTLRMSYFPVMPRWKSTHLASHLSRIMVYASSSVYFIVVCLKLK